MANFTTEDLNNITIILCNAVVVDNVHNGFKIIVKDENGQQYIWNDVTTAGDAVDSTLIDNIKAHILGLEKKVIITEPVLTTSMRTNIVGSKLI